MPHRLAAGTIVWAEIADANGVRKLRPAVIVAPTDQLVPAEPFDVVAITSRLADPLPDDHVLLPWDRRGHPRTGLNRRCAAVCTWLAQIMAGDIQDVAGIVPTPILVTILSKIAAATHRPAPSESTGGAQATDPPPSPPAASPPSAQQDGGQPRSGDVP
jgi:hypothetical protein